MPGLAIWESYRGHRMKLRVGIMCHASFGGSVRIATELAYGLAENGHTVHLFARSAPFGHWDSANGIVLHTLHSNHTDTLDPATLHLEWKDQEFSAFLAAVVQAAPSLDVLHYHYAFPFAFIAEAVKRCLGDRCPVLVGTLHGTDVSHHSQRILGGRTLAQALEALDALTTVSHSHAALSRKMFGLAAAPLIISNFINLDKFSHTENGRRARRSHRKPRLVHISNFRAVKQPEVMAAIFLEINKRTGAELWLIGNGPEMDRVQSFFGTHNLNGAVRYWDLQREVSELLVQTDLLLITSAAESFCLAALEAMACGVPVLASRVGGLPEVVIDGVTGLLFDPDQPEDAVDLALGLLTDPDRLLRMRGAAVQHASQFDRRAGVREYEALYRRLIENRGAPADGEGRFEER